ncbi:hypothetical protein ACFE04_020482 [Oxalis oulophora]
METYLYLAIVNLLATKDSPSSTAVEALPKKELSNINGDLFEAKKIVRVLSTFSATDHHATRIQSLIAEETKKPVMKEAKKIVRVSSFIKKQEVVKEAKKSTTKEEHSFCFDPKRIKRSSDNNNRGTCPTTKARVSSFTPTPKVETKKIVRVSSLTKKREVMKEGNSISCRSDQAKKISDVSCPVRPAIAEKHPSSCTARVSSLTKLPSSKKSTTKEEHSFFDPKRTCPTTKARVSSPSKKSATKEERSFFIEPKRIKRPSDKNNRGTCPTTKARVSSFPPTSKVETKKPKEDFSFLSEPKRVIERCRVRVDTRVSVAPARKKRLLRNNQQCEWLSIEKAKHAFALRKEGEREAIAMRRKAEREAIAMRRKAKRAALQKLEDEVDIDNPFETMEELKRLCGGVEVVMGQFDQQLFRLTSLTRKPDHVY